MHLETPELQLLLFAARGAAYTARMDEERQSGGVSSAVLRRKADELERVASKLEAELARATRPEPPSPPS